MIRADNIDVTCNACGDTRFRATGTDPNAAIGQARNLGWGSRTGDPGLCPECDQVVFILGAFANRMNPKPCIGCGTVTDEPQLCAGEERCEECDSGGDLDQCGAVFCRNCGAPWRSDDYPDGFFPKLAERAA
jgi:hypothetical protein